MHIRRILDTVFKIATTLLFTLHVTCAAQSIWETLTTAHRSPKQTHTKCTNKNGLKYLSGDALSDNLNCVGPDDMPYPTSAISRMYSNWNGMGSGSARRGRQSKFVETMDPSLTQKALLSAYKAVNDEDMENTKHRYSRSTHPESQCRNTPSRLCKTRYNTTAPMYGVSLTSGQPVTIVQKFPDLLQQVIFEVCESSECDVVRGECTQTYVPYLFLVIPLGPVTLTGQDYVLVESGCVCKPKYATAEPTQDTRGIIPEFK
uniref:CSON000312 protein n=1 Tax=Culicoides sonorensis TaxID=179676 RepID=A0A336MGW0_CULSO